MEFESVMILNPHGDLPSMKHFLRFDEDGPETTFELKLSCMLKLF